MENIRLGKNLLLSRCPFCNIDNPNLTLASEIDSANSEGANKKRWRFYKCGRCGCVVSACANQPDQYAEIIIPEFEALPTDLPERAGAYLFQAIQSIHAPAGAVMLCASAVDAMLKAKEYIEGSLYSRIEKAAKDHMITESMAKWAHQVRLGANDQRHADGNADLPDEADAKKSIEFVKALGHFLFVLPARIEKGIEDTKPKP